MLDAWQLDTLLDSGTSLEGMIRHDFLVLIVVISLLQLRPFAFAKELQSVKVKVNLKSRLEEDYPDYTAPDNEVFKSGCIVKECGDLRDIALYQKWLNDEGGLKQCRKNMNNQPDLSQEDSEGL